MPASPPPTTREVIIIGGGPAGLALAFELKRRGCESVVLERGPTVAHSWVNMPTHLKLVSPWKANWLPGCDPRRFPPNHQMARAEFVAVLQDYARLQGLPVIVDADVSDVSRSAEEGFVIRTSAGRFRAPVLVNATGCFARPFTPKFPGARESSVPQFHFATYRDAERLRVASGKPGGLVLIVGKRLSAGQVMLELVDAGFAVALSCRGPVQFGAGLPGSWLFFRVHPALERLKLRWHGRDARGFPAVMPGGRARRLIRSGRVGMFPDLLRFEDRRVTFADGRALEPDAVIYATGFRPALAHLASLALTVDEQTGQPSRRDFESAEVPGLFFLGLDGLHNFRSRFIRGMREDAPLLAEQLAARLRGRVRPTHGLAPAVPIVA